MIIGWQEWVSLPNLYLPIIKAKIDTGAKTSSLHADNIKHFTKDGIKYVRFEVHPIQGNKEIVRVCEAPLLDKRKVKSSSGHKEHRPIILTTLKLGVHEWPIQLNLTNRDYMGFRMLLGREAMGSAMIDPNGRLLHGRYSNKSVLSCYQD